MQGCDAAQDSFKAWNDLAYRILRPETPTKRDIIFDRPLLRILECLYYFVMPFQGSIATSKFCLENIAEKRTGLYN